MSAVISISDSRSIKHFLVFVIFAAFESGADSGNFSPMALHFIVLVQLLIQLLIVGFHLFRLTIWPLIDLPNEFFGERGGAAKHSVDRNLSKKVPFWL